MNELDDLLRCGYELIELRPKEKIPANKGWRTEKALGRAANERLRAGGNVGVRLRSMDLVCDVDPRNGGDVLMLRDINIYARVATPSGGWHVYMQKPAELVTAHTVASMPGIEFKTLGRQVVAPGSTHPNGLLYEWDPFSPRLGASAPAWLLETLSRPSAGAVGEPQLPLAEVEKMLRQLDPSDFNSNDKWLPVMMAVHEATGGQGLDMFLEWSLRDPDYMEHGAVIGARWNSLRPGGGVGVGTLRKLVLDAGGTAVVGSAAEDFEELTAATAPESDCAEVEESTMKMMDRLFRCVDEDGTARVFTRRRDSTLDREYWVRYPLRNFLEVCESVHQLPPVMIGEKFVPAGTYWLKMHKKTTYAGVTFAPEHSGDKTPDGRMNLWTGFARPAVRGEWGLLRTVIWETICRENPDWDEYVMGWLARAVQRPWEPGHVALVLKGKKGTGKSSLGSYFCRLFGRHGMHVTSPSLLSGRFNAHLRDVCALFADEAFWAGDKTGEGILKGLITESAIAYEGKGQNAEMGRNCVHLVQASNENWVAPATMDERRFAIFEVTDDKRDRQFWEKLRRQMEGPGLAAMLWDLQNRDLSGFDVFQVPQTEALAHQKLRSMEPIEAWLYELAQNEWKGLTIQGWDAGGPVVVASDMSDSLLDFYRRHNRFKAGMESVEIHVGIALKRLIPGLRRIRPRLANNHESDGTSRPWVYVLPPSDEVVRLFDQRLGHQMSQVTLDTHDDSGPI